MKRFGAFLDVANLINNSEGMFVDFGALLSYLRKEVQQEGAWLSPAVAVLVARALADGAIRLRDALSYLGWRVVLAVPDAPSVVQRWEDDADLLLAVEALTAARAGRLQGVILVSGDGDFLPVLEELQAMGVEVWVVSLPLGTSSQLRAAAQRWIDASRIPGLLRPRESTLQEHPEEAALWKPKEPPGPLEQSVQEIRGYLHKNPGASVLLSRLPELGLVSPSLRTPRIAAAAAAMLEPDLVLWRSGTIYGISSGGLPPEAVALDAGQVLATDLGGYPDPARISREALADVYHRLGAFPGLPAVKEEAQRRLMGAGLTREQAGRLVDDMRQLPPGTRDLVRALQQVRWRRIMEALAQEREAFRWEILRRLGLPEGLPLEGEP